MKNSPQRCYASLKAYRLSFREKTIVPRHVDDPVLRVLLAVLFSVCGYDNVSPQIRMNS